MLIVVVAGNPYRYLVMFIGERCRLSVVAAAAIPFVTAVNTPAILPAPAAYYFPSQSCHSASEYTDRWFHIHVCVTFRVGLKFSPLDFIRRKVSHGCTVLGLGMYCMLYPLGLPLWYTLATSSNPNFSYHLGRSRTGIFPFLRMPAAITTC